MGYLNDSCLFLIYRPCLTDLLVRLESNSSDNDFCLWIVVSWFSLTSPWTQQDWSPDEWISVMDPWYYNKRTFNKWSNMLHTTQFTKMNKWSNMLTNELAIFVSSLRIFANLHRTTQKRWRRPKELHCDSSQHILLLRPTVSHLRENALSMWIPLQTSSQSSYLAS